MSVLTFENVSFTYGGANAPYILKDANAHFEQGVFYSHSSNIEEVLHIESLCKGPALHALLCRLYILVRCEVVHNKRDLLSVEYAIESGFFEFIDCHRCGYIVS